MKRVLIWAIATWFACGIGIFQRSVFADDASDAGARKPPTAKELIKTAYTKTKTAETERDFAEIVYLVDRALRSDALTPSHRDYGKRLKGWAHNRLGESLIDRGKEHAAMGQFELAVRMNANHWKARHNRGVSFAIDGQLDRALADFTETVRLRRGFANGWFNRAEVHLRMGNLNDAVADYSEAVRLAPDDADFHHARGMAMAKGGQLDRSLLDLNRAVQLDAKFAQAFLDRGDLYVQMGSYQRAVSDYRSALEQDDQLGAAFQSLAWLMATCPIERFRDTQRALLSAEKAMSLLGEDNYHCLEVLAAAQANAGYFDEARQTQQLAIELAAKSEGEDQMTPLYGRLSRYQQQQPFRQERVARRDEPTRRTN